MEDLNQKSDAGNAMNIDSLRDEYESNREWRLRRKFLELNANNFNLDRLICLSKCFINIVIYGCSYPEAVMKVVHERSQGIILDVKAEKMAEARQKYAASFVKASSDLEESSPESSVCVHASNVIKEAVRAVKREAIYQRPLSGQVKKMKMQQHSSMQLSDNLAEAYASNGNISASKESAVCDLGGYWVNIETVTENVTDEKHIEKSKDVSLVSTKLAQNFNVEEVSNTQDSRVELVGASSNVENPNAALVTVEPSVQDTKTAAVSVGPAVHNIKTAPFNVVSSVKNPKTAHISAWQDTKNPKTTQVSARQGTKNTKTAQVNDKSNTNGTITALTKEECLTAFLNESNPILKKIRKLAFEVQNLKRSFSNAKDKLHSAGSRVPMYINTDYTQDKSKGVICHILLEDVEVAAEKGRGKKQAKTSACEAALKVIMMPRLEIIQADNNVQFLKGSFISENQSQCHHPIAPPEVTYHHNTSEGSSHGMNLPSEEPSYIETNQIAGHKRKQNQFKLVEDFIIVEQASACSEKGVINTLRQSADLSHMLLEYEFFPQVGATRCTVKIEGQIMADVVGSTKTEAKITAATCCLTKLKNICWVMKTKQAVDSSSTVSKDEIEKVFETKSDKIGHENIGNKLLQKMGWSGGGVGKHGTGIAEPVSLKSVLNRQGLGLSNISGARQTIDNFRKRVKEVVQSYVFSGNEEDLVFSPEFDKAERKIIHEECTRLNLRSNSRGRLKERYLCASRKRSVNELFDHVMSCGGETAKYKLLPPGTDVSDQSET